MQSWLHMRASDLGRGIDAGEIDPVDLCETYLEAIAAHPQADDIYARLTVDAARTAAEAAAKRARLGLRNGPLDGVPISWKDLFDRAGVPTEAGSALLKGRVPKQDAEVVRRGHHAGLVPLGNTHMSELAFSGLGLNPITATPPGLHDPTCVPGGSSSGAAASVAHGLAALAMGSDTGGSVRVPAAWNDLVGLKTTHGRLSTKGVVPLASSFDTIGPLARSVEDCALALAALEGTTPANLNHVTLRDTHFLILSSYSDDARDAPRKAFDVAIEKLVDAGAHVTRAALRSVQDALDLSAQVFNPEAYGIWCDTIEAAPDKMFQPIRDRFRAGQEFSGPDVMSAWRKLKALRVEYAKDTAAYDAVLLPTVPTLPPSRQRLMEDVEYYTTQNLLALRNTRIGNLMGLCGLTLPTGYASCGVMALAPPMTEERLLRFGVAMERALT